VTDWHRDPRLAASDSASYRNGHRPADDQARFRLLAVAVTGAVRYVRRGRMAGVAPILPRRSGASVCSDYRHGMPDWTEPPTHAIGPLPDGHGDRPVPTLPPDWPRRRRGGEHRRDPDREDRDLRWPWLAVLCVLPVLAVWGLIWLLTSIPQPGVANQVAPTTAPIGAPATSGETFRTGPVPSESRASAPTSTSAASASTSSERVAPPSPRHSPTETPTRPATPAPVDVPDVVGRRLQAATAALRAAGFEVAVVRVTTEVRRQVSRVISQSPGGGQTAPRGSTVTIRVGAAAP
jgi:hypothetical protein